MPHGQQGHFGPEGPSSRKYAYHFGTIPIDFELFGVRLNDLESLATARNHAELFRTIRTIPNCRFVHGFLCLFVPFYFASSSAT